ncbi:ribosomal RNA-processing protein 8 [Camponotus floridanus]|uniref:ribosomal RNA-processing protein 8 n=1 Tax=Camponotus floridanus TaxID=104421 RepID=UPI000DC69683|nr:ribosomal RNA-processing protein 8 [Camponotus floridanus]
MGKVDIVSQEKKPSTALKKTQSKRRRKRKSNKVLLNGIHKSELTKSNTSNEIYTFKKNIRNRKKKKDDSKNKPVAKNIEKTNPKDDNKIKVFQKAQTNLDSKIKHKKRNQRQNQGMKSNQIKNDIAKTNVSTVKNNKLQMSAKKSNHFEHNEIKIQNSERINRKKMKQVSIKTETQVESEKTLKLNKHKIKLKRLEKMLVNKPKAKEVVQSLTLRDRMMAQLRASRFRFINETLYNNESSQSKRYFKEDPDAFNAYHDGYKQQLEQWPVNPLDVIISSVKKMPTDNVIADFGCGEALLAASVPHKVHSFDFIAVNDTVKACDMAHTPLLTNSVHVVVFCLSLMGSNLSDYIIEANRVLKNNGTLKIAEVESRFENVTNFIKLLTKYGFKNTWKDSSHDLFYFMDFKKEEDISMKKKNLPSITLKSCLYKKR